MAVFLVRNLEDSGPGSLRQAIADANNTPGPDVIRFAVTGEIVLQSALPPITDHLTIDGPGTENLTINGSGNRIFLIEPGLTVVIEGLTLCRGSAADGGAMFVDTSLVTLRNITFAENNAAGSGGAIHAASSSLLAENCTFTRNGTVLAGGAIRHRSGFTILRGCRFAMNQSAVDGGALAVTGRLEMERCTLEHNSAQRGGAVALDGDAEITASTFVQNAAMVSGGAVLVETGKAVRLTGCRLSLNTAALDGGALWIGGGLVALTRCVVDRNSVNSRGGAIRALMAGQTSPSLVLVDSDLVENESNDLGGGIDAEGGTWLSITGSVIARNSALAAGGGIILSGAAAEVVASTIAGNGSSLGGGMVMLGGSTRLLNTTLSQNVAGGGAAIYANDRGMAEVSFVTVNENAVLFDPQAAAVESGPDFALYVANSIFANTHDGMGVPRPNCDANVFDLKGNFSTDDTCPGFTVVTPDRLALGLLQPNPPGRTPTHALGAASAAVDGAANCLDADLEPVRTDQRGVRRPQGRRCDSGAYERIQPRKNHKSRAHDDDDGSGR